MANLSVCLVLVVMAVTCSAFPKYQSVIPNGAKVRNPCGGIWNGVGHLHAAGMGTLNPFGSAFAAEGHVWTSILCHADSDRDGKSNGEELGDPHCHWTPTNDRHLQASSGHPGICEPIDSDTCKWQHFNCADS